MPRIRSLILTTLLVACSKGSSTSSTGSGSSTASGAAPAGAYLTVDAYCSAFCNKLCGTCGDAQCQDTCKPRCFHGRTGDLALDGKDPKVALALTQKELDACLATITAQSCPLIMGGNVRPECFTIQH